jgi:phage terminase large subunit-like protein
MRLVSPVDPRRAPRCETARELLAPRVPDAVPEPSKGARARADAERFVQRLAPDAQERLDQLFRQRELNPWKPFYCPKPGCDGDPHDNWTWQHARSDQHPPDLRKNWDTWLLNGGRGSGKTRAGAEATHRVVKLVPRIHLIAPTGPDIRDTMVEGISGILATAPPDFMPTWEPSKKRLTWPNGAIGLGFSGEEPDRLRGPQCFWAWIDEPAHMPLIGGDNGVWDNMWFGLRQPHAAMRTWACATTTPKPTKWMKNLVKDPKTQVTRVSTYANLANLSGSFREQVMARYEGTRLGRQELHGEVLEDVEGALWKIDWIVYADEVPESFDRILVSIDPAGTANKKSDETGIIVLGIINKTIYVLADRTGKYSPSGWATAAVNAYTEFSADAIVAEKNYGGDMVTEVLEKNGAKDVKIIMVTSRRGKAIRAEPIAALYEKGYTKPPVRVYHLRDATPSLEDELTSWVVGQGDSPNRLDALVHGATELAKIVMPAEIAVPSQLKDFRVPVMTSAAVR